VKSLLALEPDAMLVRNLSAIAIVREQMPGLELIADFSLNIANDLTADLLASHGIRRLTPSYDLNVDQLLDLLTSAPAHWFEVTIHQYMPMFHMEHCVFCRFLSSGTDHTNCGRPCESHKVALRDRVGYDHALKVDAGCRNTLFNAVPQSAAVYAGQLLAAGARRFRIEFLDETPEQVAIAIDAYEALLSGRAKGGETARALRAISKLGVTKGTLDSE
jgi:putative protease